MAAVDNFRKNLATAIDARGLKKLHVAAAAKTSRSYLDEVLKGTYDPSVSQAEKLAKAVGFPLTALFESPKDFSEAVLTTVPESVHS